MANPTTNLGIVLPTVGGSSNVWGTILNDALQDFDDIFTSGGTAVSLNIDGGTIDGATIGASSASTGAFTTLSASGAATLSTTLAVGAGTTASAGDIRMRNTGSIQARDFGNTDNLELISVSTSDNLSVGADTAINAIQIGDTGVPVTVKDDLEIDGALNHDGSTVGFFGTTPAAQQTTPDAPSLTSVSGSGDDLTINSNFASLESTANQIRTRLETLGLWA